MEEATSSQLSESDRQFVEYIAAAIEILAVSQRAGQDAKSLTLRCGG